MLEKIIEMLRKQEGFVSGQEMSRCLGLSRAAIWKYIDELRGLGYGITAVKNRGYCLAGSPDALFPWEVVRGLSTSWLARVYEYYDEVSSTMDIAAERAGAGAVHGTVICADTQTVGRGRMGRPWVSPAGAGVYVSLILRPEIPLVDLPKMTLMAGVAVAEAIADVSGLEPEIKWPNDLLVSGKKCAGILTEMRAQSERVDFFIIGIGVNVHGAEAGLPAGAVSLSEASGRTVSRVVLFQRMMAALEGWYGRVCEQGFDEVMETWRKKARLWGRRVRVDTGQGPFEAVAESLAGDGALVVRCDDGAVKKIYSGDVVKVLR